MLALKIGDSKGNPNHFVGLQSCVKKEFFYGLEGGGGGLVRGEEYKFQMMGRSETFNEVQAKWKIRANGPNSTSGLHLQEFSSFSFLIANSRFSNPVECK